MKKLLVIPWLFTVTSILVACQQPVAPVAQLPTPATVQPHTPTALLVPTPTRGMGVVTGIALSECTGIETATEIDLYLAEVTEVIEGGMSLASLDPGSSPEAVINETGTFIFANIPPGTYALAASISPANSALISDPETGRDLTIVVRAGDVLDLGTVYIPSLW